MSITKVGSSYNFIYNTKTGKLSTKDGSKNEFVDFCNGDVKGEDTETLNHFDEHTRYQFTRMLFAADELTGLIGAAALMRPSRSCQDMELKSLKKKYKDKKFAAGCSRDVIAQGAERLGWELDMLLERTLEAMRSCEGQVARTMEQL